MLKGNCFPCGNIAHRNMIQSASGSKPFGFARVIKYTTPLNAVSERKLQLPTALIEQRFVTSGCLATLFLFFFFAKISIPIPYYIMYHGSCRILNVHYLDQLTATFVIYYIRLVGLFSSCIQLKLCSLYIKQLSINPSLS